MAVNSRTAGLHVRSSLEDESSTSRDPDHSSETLKDKVAYDSIFFFLAWLSPVFSVFVWTKVSSIHMNILLGEAYFHSSQWWKWFLLSYSFMKWGFTQTGWPTVTNEWEKVKNGKRKTKDI